MVNLKQAARLLTQPYIALTLLTLLYLTLIFTLPVNRTTMEAYNLTPLGYKIIYFALSLPSLAAWLAAFTAYTRLQDYASVLHSSKEGRHFTRLARGAQWLAWGLPLTAIIGVTLSGLANTWSEFHPTAAIIANYIPLFFALVAFTIIGTASRGLITTARLGYTPQSSRSIMMLFVLAGVSYCFLVFQSFDLTNPGSTDNPYFLPLWLAILTISIPYLYAWFVGLLSAYEITLFSKVTRGVLYKKALRYLVAGLVVVIAASIALQYVTTAQPRFGVIIFDERLLGLLVLRLARVIGFALIIMGAARLKKIEEV